MIVVVETIDAKRENKLLPRTTVLDKIRADFATKQGKIFQNSPFIMNRIIKIILKF